MANPPEQIAPNVYRVDATKRPHAVSVLLVSDNDGWALVATGMRGSSLLIQEALGSLGAGPEDLRRIYSSHHHPDHT